MERESREFRTKFGNKLRKELMRRASVWDMTLAEYVRFTLLEHVRQPFTDPSSVAAEPEPFRPFGA